MLSISRAIALDPNSLFTALLAASSLRREKVDWFGLRIVKTIETVREVRDGQPQTNGSATSYGAMVEVLVEGQLGYAATNRLTPASLEAAAGRAYRQAKVAAQWGVHAFGRQVRPKVVGEFLTPLQSELTPREINDLLIRICYTLKVSDQVIQTLATALTTERETWFFGSNGSDLYHQSAFISTDFSATAKDGLVTQKRSDNGWFARSRQGGWETVIEPQLWERVQRIGEQAVELLSAKDCCSEHTTLVLAPDQMMLQLHESVGHPLELDRILGDERNYAGGSFVKPEDFGTLAYGSPLMNVTFDPTVEGEFASYGVDDTGALAERAYLVRAGKLERGLGSLESQERSGLPGVACARATSWNRPAIDRMGNINLEPGTTSLPDLIGNIERGVYMESNNSWSIDDQRHKFQFGCEYAKLIENGQLTQTLRNPNYRSTTPDFWRSLVAVGDRSTWETFGTPSCGKGEPNQIIWVGHGSPVCAFGNIEVFGGGS
jgi:predicted Zn-dependent protease